MGMNYNQVLAAAGSTPGLVIATLVTNQDDGIATFAEGGLTYHPPGGGGSSGGFGMFRPARLSTTGPDTSEGLLHYFSDRRLNIDPVQANEFPELRQPFSANATERLGLSMSRVLNGPVGAKFTLLSAGQVSFTVTLEERGHLLVGLGPAVGPGSDHAVYVISLRFAAATTPP